MINKLLALITVLLVMGGIHNALAQGIVTTAVGNGADATVYNDGDRGPGTNGGGSDYLEVRYWENTRFRATFIRFDISDVQDQADGAVIGCTTSDVTKMLDVREFTIYGLTDESFDSWDEGNISYNNAPGFESAPAGNFNLTEDLDELTSITVYGDSTGSYFYSESSAEMDSFINNDTNSLVTLVIVRTYSNNDDIFMFNSKEAGEMVAPRLVFESENGEPVLPNFYPTITLNSPADGVRYYSNTTLTAKASVNDADGEIESVSFYLDDSEIDMLSSSPWETEIDLSEYSLGAHEFYALVRDNEGAEASSDTVEFEIIESDDNGDDSPPRVMEELDRGLIAIDRGDDVFLSWRMLGKDPQDIGFNVYRNDTKVNYNPITDRTNYVDPNGSSESSYHITPVVDGTEGTSSGAVEVWGNPYLDIALNRPPAGPQGGTYSPNDMSVGDLDGDHQYELIIKWYPSNARDNAHDGYTDATLLEAVELDGTSMWRIDLGKNIRSGAHYTQFMVYDLDSDGKAEVACKTAPGTVAGDGSFLSTGPAADDDDSADYRTSSGRINYPSPEYLTVFDGETGEELQTELYIPQYDFKSNPEDFWGDDYGNRSERYLAAIGYFNGRTPSLAMARGYYEGYVVAAWDWDGENLTHRWSFEAGAWDGSLEYGHDPYGGQGNHNIAVGDVDDDGKDEIMYGSAAIDDDGTGLYTTELGHGDAGHLGDLDPDRPGLEFYMPHEWSGPGVTFRDAGTGEIIWSYDSNSDVGRGVAGDVSTDYRGAEAWGLGTYNCKGEQISISPSSTNFLIHWDGDVTRELLDGNRIDDLEKGRLLTAQNHSSNNGSKATPNLSADILGDWREEVIWRSNDNNRIRIYTTTDTTDVKRYTLMHDPVYRLGIAWQNVAYNQPPHTGYYLPDGSPQPNMIYPDELEVGVADDNPEPAAVAEDFALTNFPNPFNPQTTISFRLNMRQPVNLSVYTLQGKKIVTLVDGEVSGGLHEVIFDARNQPSGVYFYRLQTQDEVVTNKMLLLK